MLRFQHQIAKRSPYLIDHTRHGTHITCRELVCHCRSSNQTPKYRMRSAQTSTPMTPLGPDSWPQGKWRICCKRCYGCEQYISQRPGTAHRTWSSNERSLFSWRYDRPHCQSIQIQLGWEPLDTLSSDHRPILITIHPTNRETERDKRLVWQWRKGDLAAFTTAADEQLRGSGLTYSESMTQMYRTFSKAVLAAARRHIGLKAVGITGEYGKG